jgi:hypothetical protein
MPKAMQDALSFRVPDDIRSWVIKEAGRRGESRAEICREVMRAGFDYLSYIAEIRPMLEAMSTAQGLPREQFVASLLRDAVKNHPIAVALRTKSGNAG